jgi:hypothetical protein
MLENVTFKSIQPTWSGASVAHREDLGSILTQTQTFFYQNEFINLWCYDEIKTGVIEKFYIFANKLLKS